MGIVINVAGLHGVSSTSVEFVRDIRVQQQKYIFLKHVEPCIQISIFLNNFSHISLLIGLPIHKWILLDIIILDFCSVQLEVTN